MSFHFRNKTLLIISPETWGENMLSKHHYALQLAEDGNQVYFLSPGKKQNDHNGPANIQFIDSPQKIKGLRFLPAFIRKRSMRQQIVQIEACIQKKIDVVWSFDNSWLFHLDLFGKEVLRIAHIADHNMDYQSEPFCRSASLCLGVTKQITQRLATYNPTSFHIAHGVRIENETAGKSPLLNSEKTKALYVGNILIPFLNRALLLRLFEHLPEIDFYLMGSTRLDNLNRTINSEDEQFLKQLEAFEHVHFISSKQGIEYRETIESSDLCFLAYNHIVYPDQTANSHKILEYLSAGKAVITMPISDYSKGNILYSAQDESEYIGLFKEYLEHPTHFTSLDLIAKRKKLASDNSYENKILEVERLISNYVN